MAKLFFILVELAKTDPALIDQGNLLKSDCNTYSRYDTGGVNTIPPNTEKWIRKRLRENNGYGIQL